MYTQSFTQLLRRNLSLLFILTGLALSGCSKDDTEIIVSKPGEDGKAVLTKAIDSSIPLTGVSEVLPPGEWFFCLKAVEREGDEPAKEFFIPGSAGDKKDGTYMHLLLPENTVCMHYIVSYVTNADKSIYYDLGFPIEIREDGSIACSITYNKEKKKFGSGTKEDPFLISSLGDIVLISAANPKNDLTGLYFKQIVDIVCNDGTDLNTDNGGIQPVGNNEHPFTSHYDGDGHYIEGLSFVCSGNGKVSNYVALFGVIDKDASISNLTMKEINIQDSQSYIGGIVGCMRGNSKITNCTVNGGIIHGTNYVGGIVGCIEGGAVTNCSNNMCSILAYTTKESPITNCLGGIIGNINPKNGAAIEVNKLSAATEVSGHSNVGGIIGFIGGTGTNQFVMSDLTITIGNSSVKTIAGINSVGGLIGGCTASLTLRNSSAITLIKSSDIKNKTTCDFGGLIGTLGTTGSVQLNNCKMGLNSLDEQPDASKKYIEGEFKHAGGLIGYARADGGLELSNCKVASNIEAKQFVGSFIGRTVSNTTLKSCTNNKATINATDKSESYVGGLVGCADENITFEGAGNQNVGNVIAAGAYAGGFLGAAKKEVKLTGGSVTADVTAAGPYAGGYVGYAEILTAYGINDGGQTPITIGAGEYQGGVAGYAASGTIRYTTLGSHIGLAGSKAPSSGGIVGFLVNGTIETSTFKGSVQGGQYTGGIAGRQNGGRISSCNTNSKNNIQCNDGGMVGGIIGGMTQVSISNCINETSVVNTGELKYTGGIIGYIDAQSSNKSIIDCINKATVTGYDRTGGILGGTVTNDTNSTQITRCHNTGTITGGWAIGGISGLFVKGRILLCSNHGTVTANEYHAGGIAGYFHGSISFHPGGLISECYNIGTVDGPVNVGGLVGCFELQSYARILNSYNRARVGHDGSRNCAGIVGYIGLHCNAEISYCYSGGEERTGWGIFGAIGAETALECSWTRCHYSEESARSDKHNTPDYTRNTNGGLSNQNNFHGWNFNNIWIMKTQPQLRSNLEKTY